MFKAGFISIIGKPNTGKSTLLNHLAGYKIAITTSKPQTTRFNIKGIVNNPNSQMIFIDTPGIHKAKHKLGEYMNENANESTNGSDVTILLIDSTKPIKDNVTKEILENLKNVKHKIMVITKVDAVNKESILGIIHSYSQDCDFDAIIPISVHKKDGTDELLKEIEKYLPESPALYDEDEITDLTEKEIVEEMIREKALNFLSEEIPHGILVQVESMKNRTKNNAEIYDIEANIFVEKKSHKGMVIGKDGIMLKRIGTSARQDIERMLDAKCNIQLWVKVKEDWRDQDFFLKKFAKK